ncbi:MFS transporter [Scleromatobacter humisilvae]|uniref:MFS transporter n=1 Tax=Scleromatobacter humisilvae TaxID=2897159 RepID=A0A9X1YPY7_9BURK|nr:MFS transporter [Scleromatobacter humisilvae]MCK9688627.1 MFS transporter [Scleromatobacter humisilvae]
MSATAVIAAPRVGGRHAAILLVTLAVLSGSAARYVLSPMQELVRADLGLDDNHVALLQGMSIALPTTLLSIPLGRLVDRTHRSRLLVVLALACAIGSAMMAFAPGFATAFAARMLVGAAVIAAQPTALSLVADLTEASERGRMVTLVSIGQALGGSLGYAIAGPLLKWLPAELAASGLVSTLAAWRLVLLAAAAGVVAATVPLLFLREPVRRELGTAASGNLRAAWRELASYRGFLLPLAGGMVTVGMADAAATIWAVPVLTRNFHQKPEDFGAWLGLLNLVANVLGAILGGWMADWGQRRGGRAGALLGALLGAALSIPAAFYPVMPNVAMFAWAMGLFLTCGAWVSIAAISSVMVVLPNELRGTFIGVLVAAIGMTAYGIAPLLVSFGAHAGDGRADIALSLTVVGLATSVLGTLSFVAALRAARARA